MFLVQLADLLRIMINNHVLTNRGQPSSEQ